MYSLEKLISDTVAFVCYQDKLLGCKKEGNDIFATFKSGMKLKVTFEISQPDDDKDSLQTQ